jgi:hypothetical protein
MTAEGRIFLAHAREDKAQVRKLYADLKARGFKPWLDDVDLVPGQIWKDEIPKAIRQAKAFLACMSSQSVNKIGYVQNEFRLALAAFGERPQGSIYLIPVRLDDCDVPDLQIPDRGLSLRDIQWVDLWEESGLDRLAIGIELALGASEPAAQEVWDQKVKPDWPSGEAQILQLLRQGVPNQEIARRLAISEVAVKAAIRRVLDRLREEQKPRRL